MTQQSVAQLLPQSNPYVLNYKNILNTYTSSNNNKIVNICPANVNYTAKRDFLFRFVQPNIRNQIKMDDEALYSTTDQLTADRISKDLLKFIPNTSTVTDATACVGGTAYSFSQFFNTVNAIEIDTKRYTLLIHNLNILLKESGKNNINYYNNNALEVCTQLKQNAIFIDPPWGGPDYKQIEKLSLFLSDIELSIVCKNLYMYTDYLVLKVPTNFDEEAFIANTHSYMNLVHKNTSLRKMYLLIFSTNTSTNTNTNTNTSTNTNPNPNPNINAKQRP